VVLAAVLASALAVVLAVVLPLAARPAYRRYLRRLAADPGARLSQYRRVIARDWAAAGLVVLIGALAGRTPRSVGLPAYPGGADMALAAEVLALTCASMVPAMMVLRRRGERHDEMMVTHLQRVIGLVPITRGERAGYAALSVTAGICEELLFRGFAVGYLRWLWPAAPWPWLILATSVPFGLGHLYQGAAAAVWTAVIGALFCWITLASGTLLVAMLVHAAIDLRNLAIPGELARRADAVQRAGGYRERPRAAQ